MLQRGTHFLGIQGHPEFSRDYSRALMLKRQGVIPAERLQEGLASLDREVDDQRVARWLLNFIRGTS
jgi:GMP synthase (glutamine-hydrolysing)